MEDGSSIVVVGGSGDALPLLLVAEEGEAEGRRWAAIGTYFGCGLVGVDVERSDNTLIPTSGSAGTAANTERSAFSFECGGGGGSSIPLDEGSGGAASSCPFVPFAEEEEQEEGTHEMEFRFRNDSGDRDADRVVVRSELGLLKEET
jgi:hypothetical protein